MIPNQSEMQNNVCVERRGRNILRRALFVGCGDIPENIPGRQNIEENEE